ncbi:MAG: hypothetical protein Ct9H300mP21_01080 [Pseudomonadota bacterium]|nr:MAG: hypothetical protein Ct9H300mP21_01080 [Pseudomonadota bacterium]
MPGPDDPKVWREYKLSEAKVVVSCTGSDLDSDLELAVTLGKQHLIFRF